jgi:hypothetical protein
MGVKRHKPTVAVGRCCWICGKVGGMGATLILRGLGYEVQQLPGGRGLEIAYAHPDCLARAKKRADVHRQGGGITNQLSGNSGQLREVNEIGGGK